MIRYLLSFSAIILVSTIVIYSAVNLVRYSFETENNLAILNDLYVPKAEASKQNLASGYMESSSKLCELSKSEIVVISDRQTLRQVLVANGYSDSFAFIKKLSAKLGFDQYQGTIEQNRLLLKQLISDKNHSVCILNSIWL